ncbi:transcription termination/antitermination protein NusG [Neotamlana laminarinivorans]|uniref:UpxY family transcription antiterminator n=1 Tax=Neotamlana laminarinivorans TaxID=2883124 RepID=A0A9X1L1R8_9FLAO|nr:UpxY family transcription antiterminator [Tamlana laminarinivorans]MCB4798990.1 UpxY family transcription antiterminator [Tamlana laminarinivorans]
MNWFVLSVKRNQEKKVAEILQKMNIEVFNPIVKEIKYWSNAQKVVETPLFQTYIFTSIPSKYRGLVFGIPGVNGYVSFNGKPASVHQEDIKTIQKWVKDDTYDLVLLSKLISNKQINVQKWLMNNPSGQKAIGANKALFLLKEMDGIVNEKLRKVV